MSGLFVSLMSHCLDLCEWVVCFTHCYFLQSHVQCIDLVSDVKSDDLDVSDDVLNVSERCQDITIVLSVASGSSVCA